MGSRAMYVKQGDLRAGRREVRRSQNAHRSDEVP